MTKVLLQRILSCFLIIAFMCTLSAQFNTKLYAQALPSDDIEGINKWPNWVPGTSFSQVCGGTTNLVGSENAEKIYNYFIAKGLTPPQAAGIMGNLQAESGMNPRRVQNTPTPGGDRDVMALDGRTGFGIAQWTSLGRQQALHKAAVTAGKQDSDLGVQLDYLWKEMEESYKNNVLNPIRASQDVRQVTSIFMTQFERPADQSQRAQNERAKFSIALLAKYGSNAISSTNPSDSPSTNTSGCASGNYSLPVDKKWYDQNKEWFTKPHHDYPAADIPVPIGTPVYSITSGKVIDAPNGSVRSGYGLGVTIDAGNGIIINYGHGSDGGAVSGAKEGDTVQPGQLIMHSANTGKSSGPHLHVDIQINGKTRCPQQLFVGIAEGSAPDINSLPGGGCSY